MVPCVAGETEKGIQIVLKSRDYTRAPSPCYTSVMVSFSELRNSFKFQRQAKKVQSELKYIHVEAEASGVKVVVSAGMEVVSMEIAPEVPREKIPALAVDALNRAMKKAQVVSAERMQGVMGEMGLGVK